MHQLRAVSAAVQHQPRKRALENQRQRQLARKMGMASRQAIYKEREGIQEHNSHLWAQALGVWQKRSR